MEIYLEGIFVGFMLGVLFVFGLLSAVDAIQINRNCKWTKENFGDLWVIEKEHE